MKFCTLLDLSGKILTFNPREGLSRRGNAALLSRIGCKQKPLDMCLLQAHYIGNVTANLTCDVSNLAGKSSSAAAIAFSVVPDVFIQFAAAQIE